MSGHQERIEGWLVGVGGVRLYWQGWLPRDDLTGVLLICHGSGEHSGRYGNVVSTLSEDGWAVYGLDLRGHGRSGGPRVDLERFSDWLDDFEVFRQEIAARHPDLPIFLLGHSLGGLIALAYALDRQEVINGLVLSAPFLATASVPKVVRPVARLAAWVAPRTRVGLVDLNKISKDPDVVSRYQSDPLVYHGNATLAYATIVGAQFETLPERAKSLRLPLLLQHGTLDEIADPSGSRLLDSKSGSIDQTVFWYEGLWHEIYNEPERDRPLKDLREWLAAHR